MSKRKSEEKAEGEPKPKRARAEPRHQGWHLLGACACSPMERDKKLWFVGDSPLSSILQCPACIADRSRVLTDDEALTAMGPHIMFPLRHTRFFVYCGRCKEEFKTVDEARTHVCSYETKTPHLVSDCESCKAGSDQPRDLWWFKAGRYAAVAKCKECTTPEDKWLPFGDFRSLFGELEFHKGSLLGTDKVRIECSACGFHFRDRMAAHKHVVDEHGDEEDV